MQTAVKSEIENLIVDFYEVKAGWIYFKLSFGENSFNTRFTQVFDPIIDFKNWLEALAIGVKQCSFEFDIEGDDIKFDFDRIHWDKEFFAVSEAYENGEVFLKAQVSRKQVVSALYWGLIHFAETNTDFSDEWEIQYVKERLCNFLKIDESKLIDTLLKLNRVELQQTLFDADPYYTVSFPDAKNKEEEIKWFIESIKQDEEKENINRVKTPDEWEMPDDFDLWNIEKKNEFISDCINQKARNGCSGTKVKEFRSEIIEQYLQRP